MSDSANSDSSDPIVNASSGTSTPAGSPDRKPSASDRPNSTVPAAADR